MSGERPQEFCINEKWDACIDLALRRIVYGTLGGGAAALILFRGGAARAACAGLGAGFGMGSAYSDCQREVHSVVGSQPKEEKGEVQERKVVS